MDRGGNYDNQNNQYGKQFQQQNMQYENPQYQGMSMGNRINEGKLDLIALIVSIVSILCCGLTSIISFVMSIIVVTDKTGKYPRKGKAIAAMCISLAMIFISFWMIFVNMWVKTEKPIIPDVTGMSYYDAIDTIDNAVIWKLDSSQITKEEEYSDNIEKGLVIRTSPAVGEEISTSSQITIYISKGKELIMPNIIGMSKEDAKASLSQIGLEVNITEEYSDAEVGTVIDAEYIAGSEISNTDNSIDIVVSKGTKEQEIQTLKENAQSVTYDDLIRYPSTYETTPIKIKVSISDLEAQSFLGIQYDTAIWASYSGETLILSDDRDTKEPSLRECDTVTIYGYGKGTTTIETKQKDYQGSLVFGFSYDKTVDSYEVPYISIQYVEF